MLFLIMLLFILVVTIFKWIGMFIFAVALIFLAATFYMALGRWFDKVANIGKTEEQPVQVPIPIANKTLRARLVRIRKWEE